MLFDFPCAVLPKPPHSAGRQQRTLLQAVPFYTAATQPYYQPSPLLLPPSPVPYSCQSCAKPADCPCSMQEQEGSDDEDEPEEDSEAYQSDEDDGRWVSVGGLGGSIFVSCIWLACDAEGRLAAVRAGCAC